MVPETRVLQAADGEDLVILACTVFDWSTRVTDKQTELWWLRCAIAVAAIACKNITAAAMPNSSEGITLTCQPLQQ